MTVFRRPNGLILSTHGWSHTAPQTKTNFIMEQRTGLSDARRFGGLQMAIEPLDILKQLARMRGTTLDEEIAKHNATLRPMATPEEAAARKKASRRRALDKMKAKRAALRALKPVPTAEEIAAKAVARAARDKASRRKHRVDARDALRAHRKTTGRPAKLKHQKGTSELTASERRARKAVTDKRYVQATQGALRLVRRSSAEWHALRTNDLRAEGVGEGGTEAADDTGGIAA